MNSRASSDAEKKITLLKGVSNWASGSVYPSLRWEADGIFKAEFWDYTGTDAKSGISAKAKADAIAKAFQRTCSTWVTAAAKGFIAIAGSYQGTKKTAVREEKNPIAGSYTGTKKTAVRERKISI
jgi:hypothetical protein